MNRRLITATRLVEGHAFSFEDQPYLADLMRDVRNTANRVTFVFGSGVSIDSGLPTWPKLIANLAALLPVEVRQMAAAEESDLMRKAEYLLQMTGLEKAKAIRLALRLDDATPPGAMAVALARLSRQLENRARVITTNFDDMYERACRWRPGRLDHVEGDLQRRLGRNVRSIREGRGISQEDFADELGFHRTYLGASERGERNLSLRSVERLAMQLGTVPLKLLQ